jgi:ACR3 family arsenite transporter
MARATEVAPVAKGLGWFERSLTLWVVCCIAAGIVLGKIAPGTAAFLDGLALYAGDAPVVSLPIAVCLCFMIYPIVVKIDFGEVVKAGRNMQPVTLTLLINWAIKPFTMYAIALFFLGTLFLGFIGPAAVDYVKMPLYLAGCMLLGIAPCTAMVLVWGYLARGNDGHTLVMVAINSFSCVKGGAKKCNVWVFCMRLSSPSSYKVTSALHM